MPSLLPRKYRTFLAENLIDSLSSNAKVAYVFLGRPQEWDSDVDPPTPEDNTQNLDFEFWRDMVGAKRVGAANTAYVVARRDWTANTVYDQYDDTADLSTLEFYVLDVEEIPYKVYKCLWNNGGVPSTEAPSGIGTSVNPGTTADGYVWQYMYTVGSEHYKFLTTQWMPVLTDNTVVDNAETFAGRLPTAVPFLIIDGGASYNAAVATNTVITGDGSGANVTSNGVSITSGEVTSVVLASGGAGYSQVTAVDITQAGATQATVRAIIPPYPNHGGDPVHEFGAAALMFHVAFSDDEGEALTIDNDFRRVGVIIDPIDANTGAIATETFYRQTYDITFSANTGVLAPDDVITNITKDSEPTAIVVDVVPGANANYIVRLTRVDTKGETAPFEVDDVIKNLDSGVEVTIDEVSAPKLTRYTGSIIAVNQRTPVTRSDDQTEEVKVVFPFA